MLQQRASNNNLSDNGCVRYMMADSSMQHGRDFEHIVVRTIKHDMLPELLDISIDLCEMWRLGLSKRLCLCLPSGLKSQYTLHNRSLLVEVFVRRLRAALQARAYSLSVDGALHSPC